LGGHPLKPLFTIHAGEFVVGEYIERTFRRVNLWVPTRDTGMDLLVTNAQNQKSVSLQVKFSRDWLSVQSIIFQKPVRACGWWSLDRLKIANSKADYWVFVLVGLERRSTDFVILKPTNLLTRLDSIHGRTKRFQSYLWVTEKGRCWETRGLKRKTLVAIAQDEYSNKARDFSKYLNNWSVLQTLDKK
jgi:hypothetical protein